LGEDEELQQEEEEEEEEENEAFNVWEDWYFKRRVM